MSHANETERLAFVGSKAQLPTVLALAPHGEDHQVPEAAPACLVVIAARDRLPGLYVLVGVGAHWTPEPLVFRCAHPEVFVVEHVRQAQDRTVFKEPLIYRRRSQLYLFSEYRRPRLGGPHPHAPEPLYLLDLFGSQWAPRGLIRRAWSVSL
jgi:hypothetical protein